MWLHEEWGEESAGGGSRLPSGLRKDLGPVLWRGSRSRGQELTRRLHPPRTLASLSRETDSRALCTRRFVLLSVSRGPWSWASGLESSQRTQCPPEMALVPSCFHVALSLPLSLPVSALQTVSF